MIGTTRNIILVLTTMVLFTQCSQQQNTIRNKDLQVEVNDTMYLRINSLNEDAKTLMEAYSSSEYLVTSNGTIRDFLLTNSQFNKVSDDIGEGKRYTFEGLYEQDGYRIRKILEITTYQGFENIAFLNTKFVNEGDESLKLKKWVTNHYKVTDHQNDPAFYSFQSETTSEREDWIKPISKGFYQRNYQGMNSTDYGGGIPVTDLWRPDAGIGIGHTEMKPKRVSLPVEYKQESDYASVWIQNQLRGQSFEKGDTLTTTDNFVMVHEGDAYTPLRTFSNYMQARGIEFVEPEPAAYEPIWCAWGYGRDFTIDQIVNTLPKVKELGIDWAVIDDGFQQTEGDWMVNQETFPNGEPGMKQLVDKIHSMGLKAKLWWAPLAVDSTSNLLKKDPDLLLLNKDGSPQYITWWDAYYMSPAYEGTREHTRNVLEMFLKDWGFDGLKMDGQHMNMVPPDYNESHNLSYPEESVEALPEFFKMIYHAANQYDGDAVIEHCPCGTVMNFYNMPYMNQAVSSDPLDSWQIRLKGKVYKALIGKTAYYGDHVELSDNGEDFASSFGVGAVLGTKFTWSEPDDSSLSGRDRRNMLTPKKEKKWKKWFSLYNQKMLSKEKYLGSLYDIGYGKPETHVIQKADTLFYAFYENHYEGTIRLKGLEKGKNYVIHDYVNDKNYGVVSGDEPTFKASFDRNLLVEVYPEQ